MLSILAQKNKKSTFFENYQEKATSGTAGGFECQDVLSGDAGEKIDLFPFSKLVTFFPASLERTLAYCFF